MDTVADYPAYKVIAEAGGAREFEVSADVYGSTVEKKY